MRVERTMAALIMNSEHHARLVEVYMCGTGSNGMYGCECRLYLLPTPDQTHAGSLKGGRGPAVDREDGILSIKREISFNDDGRENSLAR